MNNTSILSDLSFGKIKDLSGQVFGRLTALYPCCNLGAKDRIYWVCICSCGSNKIVRNCGLSSGEVSSCGCKTIELNRTRAITHGMVKSLSYNSWVLMKGRCLNKDHKDFKYYGGRGITVCSEWANSFEEFYADMGDREKGMTLERLNVNEGYSPANCIWASRQTQSNNTRRNIKITYNGKTLSVAEWCRELEIPYWRTISRIENNWDYVSALTIPTQKRKKQEKV